MRVDRRPLLDTAVDADLFVDRQAELARLLRAVDLGLNAVVAGPRGVGTTSLLRHVLWCLRSRGVGAPQAAHLSAADLPDAENVVRRLHRRLAGDEAAAVATVAGWDAAATIDRIAAGVGDTAGEGAARTVVVLDDLAPAVGRALFGALRDELWRLPITWLVGVPADGADPLLRAPVDAFFEVVVRLAPLDEDAATRLLRTRVGDALSDKDLRRLVRLGEGHPRRMLDLARRVVVDGCPVDELAATSESRDERLQAVSAPAAALAAELESLGSAGPSDSGLQQRMGVSRPRLVSLFAELRDAGLVREAGADRNGSRPGRPRVRYTLTDDLPPAETVGGARDPRRR
jgi:hypothetical protein